MDKEQWDALAAICMERAKELLGEVEVLTHNGAMKMFNMKFIHSGDGSFSAEDYQRIAKAEQIRNASDYDDFYIASKEETRQQVKNAAYFVEKVEKYLSE